MRRIVSFLCAVTLLLGVACAERLPGEALEGDAGTFSGLLARDALALSMFSTAAEARAALTDAGFDIVLQMHYDKPATDLSDTCAYTVGKKTVSVNGSDETLLLVSIRGTGAGEWYSNFDIASPDDPNPTYAKGFYLSAVDVMERFAPIYEAEGMPYTVVTGYSRGAACANLVGLLMDNHYGGDRLYVYTFATPRTVRGAYAGDRYGNIFNIVFETDVVPRVPLAAWGFERAGTDITLPGKASDVKRLENGLNTLLALAPTVGDYYHLKHSLAGPGAAEDGVSAFAFMTGLIDDVSGLLGGGASNGLMSKLMDMIKLNTDFTPFLSLLLTLSMNDMALLKSVGMRHMPETYAAQLSAYIEQTR